MGFIKHALIGIALYEATKYFLKKEQAGFSANGICSNNPGAAINRRRLNTDDFKVDLKVGTDRDTPLSGLANNKDHDAWKNSLANDELRAPDS